MYPMTLYQQYARGSTKEKIYTCINSKSLGEVPAITNQTLRLCHYNEFDFFIKKKQFFTKIGTFRMLYLHLTKFRHAESVLMVERDKS